LNIEGKLKDVPKIEQLESHLANKIIKIIEQDVIKNQLEQLQVEKQKETQTIQEKHEQEMKDMREQMNQIMSLIQQNPMLAQVKPEALVKKKL
jgi:Txe/YoeB family toxin of Txe-Axe toxin-antitoxin module